MIKRVINRIINRSIIPALIICFCFSCSTQKIVPIQEPPPPIDPFLNTAPDGMYWHDEALPEIFAMPDAVGLISSGAILNAEQRIALQKLFRSCYFDALVNGLPVKSVLGLDTPHPWPSKNPLTWVQNWQSADYYPNSWGIPNLVLAVLSNAEDEVLTVHGPFLDFYGLSRGKDAANGAAGYGTPCSDVYYYKDPASPFLKSAQRFEYGVFILEDQNKITFVKEDPPSLKYSPDANVGIFENENPPLPVKKYFVKAWKNFVNKYGKPIVSDGNVQYIDLSNENWMPFLNSKLRGLYVQFFEAGAYAAVLGVYENDAVNEYAMRCHILQIQFLETLIRNARISGAETLRPWTMPHIADKRTEYLMRGLCLYGIPMTDIMSASSGTELVMRFSKGKMFYRFLGN